MQGCHSICRQIIFKNLSNLVIFQYMTNHPHEIQNRTEEDTIFDEAELLNKPYDKSIRNARIAIYIIAAAQFLMGIFQAYYTEGKAESLGVFVLTSALSLAYVGLALYSRKKPFNGILAALIVYGLFVVVDLVFDPASIFKGILLKAAVIYYLAKALGDAREMQAAMKTFGKS